MREQRRSPRAQQRRQLLAAETARIIMENGAPNARSARRKAAHRLGFGNEHELPDFDEIDAAVRERQRLFSNQGQSQQLQALRAAAVEAMMFLSQFDPRLVGPVLDGAADQHTVVTLHLHCDDSSAVERFLDDHGIRSEQSGRRVRLDRDRSIDATALCFVADGDPFELLVLPTAALRQAPLDPHDCARTWHRASVTAVRALL